MDHRLKTAPRQLIEMAQTPRPTLSDLESVELEGAYIVYPRKWAGTKYGEYLERVRGTMREEGMEIAVVPMGRWIETLIALPLTCNAFGN